MPRQCPFNLDNPHAAALLDLPYLALRNRSSYHSLDAASVSSSRCLGNVHAIYTCHWVAQFGQIRVITLVPLQLLPSFIRCFFVVSFFCALPCILLSCSLLLSVQYCCLIFMLVLCGWLFPSTPSIYTNFRAYLNSFFQLRRHVYCLPKYLV